MDAAAPLDPAIIDAIGSILGKGGSAASVILAYFGYRIFKAVQAYLDRFLTILERLEKHLPPEGKVP